MGLNTRFRLSAKLKAGTPNKIIKPLLWLSPWIVSGEGTSHVEGFYMERDIVVTSHGITISRSNYGNLLE